MILVRFQLSNELNSDRQILSLIETGFELQSLFSGKTDKTVKTLPA